MKNKIRKDIVQLPGTGNRQDQGHMNSRRRTDYNRQNQSTPFTHMGERNKHTGEERQDNEKTKDRETEKGGDSE